MLHTHLLSLMYIWALFVNPLRFAWYKTDWAHYWLIYFSTTLPVAGPNWSSNACVMWPVAEEKGHSSCEDEREGTSL